MGVERVYRCAEKQRVNIVLQIGVVILKLVSILRLARATCFEWEC